MKIVCGQCGAKYSIADEKLAGKVVKIRCKKCDTIFEARGTDGDDFNDENTQVFDGLTAWFVVINGEQQGPYSTDDMATLSSNGQVSLESYVWTEGFADWKAAAEIPEIAVLMQAQAAAHVHAAPITMGSDVSQPAAVFTAQSSNHPATAQSGFSSPASSVSGATTGAGMFSAQQPHHAGSANSSMTGQRNENSVLFSLDRLKGLSETAASNAHNSNRPAPAPSFANRSTANNESSGLIDIRALAQNAPDAAARRGADQNQDLLSLGGGNAFTQGLAQVATTRKSDDSSTKFAVWIALSVMGMLLLGMLGLLILRTPMAQPMAVATDTAIASTPIATAEATPGAVAAAKPSAAVKQPNAVAATPDAAKDDTKDVAKADGASETDEANKADAGVKTPSKDSHDKASKETRAERRARLRAAPTEGDSTTADASASPSADNDAKPAATAARAGGGKRDLDSLMDDVLGGGGGGGSKAPSAASPRQAPADSGLPESPAREEIARALSGVRGAVKSCGAGETGVATVNVVFTGSTGRVSNASILDAPFRGTAAGSCIERAVKAARVPQFKSSTFQVKFPYRI